MLFVNMREDPIFTKCCHCIPLQSCLHAWVGVKIVADVSISFCLIFLMLVLFGFHDGRFFDKFHFEHVLIIVCIMLMVDCAIMVTLSVGLCRNSVQVVKLFFYYNITMIVLEALILAIMYICTLLDTGLVLRILFPICSVAYICLDICIALTAKSEMIKLRNKEQFEFVKIPASNTEPQKTQEVPIEIENLTYS